MTPRRSRPTITGWFFIVSLSQSLHKTCTDKLVRWRNRCLKHSKNKLSKKNLKKTTFSKSKPYRSSRNSKTATSSRRQYATYRMLNITKIVLSSFMIATLTFWLGWTKIKLVWKPLQEFWNLGCLDQRYKSIIRGLYQDSTQASWIIKRTLSQGRALASAQVCKCWATGVNRAGSPSLNLWGQILAVASLSHLVTNRIQT